MCIYYNLICTYYNLTVYNRTEQNRRKKNKNAYNSKGTYLDKLICITV